MKNNLRKYILFFAISLMGFVFSLTYILLCFIKQDYSSPVIYISTFMSMFLFFATTMVFFIKVPQENKRIKESVHEEVERAKQEIERRANAPRQRLSLAEIANTSNYSSYLNDSMIYNNRQQINIFNSMYREQMERLRQQAYISTPYAYTVSNLSGVTANSALTIQSMDAAMRNIANVGLNNTAQIQASPEMVQNFYSQMRGGYFDNEGLFMSDEQKKKKESKKDKKEVKEKKNDPLARFDKLEL